jgi:nitrogen regulatory protein PII
MKAVFIVYNQAHVEEVEIALARNGIRGFTRWEDVQGAGSRGGEPHLGSHAWPGKNMSTLAITEEIYVDKLLAELKAIDESAEMQGLRAFVWNIEATI